MNLGLPNSLVAKLNDFYVQNDDVTIVSVSTSDGFEIHQSSVKKFQQSSDMVAAIASTFSSLSNSIAKEIVESPFKAAFIETGEGNFICVCTQCMQKNMVLTICADGLMSIGVLRAKAKNLAKEISNL